LLGCIVSKRKDSRYRSGCSRDWVKMKNPNAPAVTRPRPQANSWLRRHARGRDGGIREELATAVTNLSNVTG
jgi:hypothetical protein